MARKTPQNPAAVPTELNGRGADGKFQRGNSAARGNPLNRKAQQLRAALLRAVGEDGITKATAAVLEKACAGDVLAYRELCNRVVGTPSPTEVLDRLAAI